MNSFKSNPSFNELGIFNNFCVFEYMYTCVLITLMLVNMFAVIVIQLVKAVMFCTSENNY
jgi:hypothetical protein